MENEKSKIPVYSCQQSKMTDISKGAVNCERQVLQSKKQCLKVTKKKVPGLVCDENNLISVPLKDTNQCPMNKYKQGADLRKRNKWLETARCELNSKLVQIQKELEEKRQENDNLEEENQKLKKFQESCMLILETRDCDPAAAENVLEEEEENKKRRAEITDLTEKLTADLELFIQKSKEQKKSSQDTHIKWKQLKEDQAHFLEQWETFERETENWFAILDQEDSPLDSS